MHNRRMWGFRGGERNPAPGRSRRRLTIVSHERGILDIQAAPRLQARRRPVLDLYYWPTPNGHKIAIFLEEAGVPYRIHPINIGKGEQFAPGFLGVSPNNKIPALA